MLFSFGHFCIKINTFHQPGNPKKAIVLSVSKAAKINSQIGIPIYFQWQLIYNQVSLEGYEMTPKELRLHASNVKSFHEDMILWLEKASDSQIDAMVKNNHPYTRLHMEILRQWAQEYKTSALRAAMIAYCKHVAAFPAEYAFDMYSEDINPAPEHID